MYILLSSASLVLASLGARPGMDRLVVETGHWWSFLLAQGAEQLPDFNRNEKAHWFVS